MDELNSDVSCVSTEKMKECLQQIQENSISSINISDVIEYLIDGIEPLKKIVYKGSAFLDDLDKFIESCKANEILQDTHAICNGLYKDNKISKETYVKFIEKYHGKSVDQMLSDYNEMKNNLLSTAPLEKVGYISISQMKKNIENQLSSKKANFTTDIG